jgi:hypothetical protein
MGKTRHWLLLALGSLGIAAGSLLAGSAATLAGQDAAPGAEQNWSSATFSNPLEPSGPPEFGRCIKTTGGAYIDGGCTTSGAGGSFEWYSAFGSTRPLEKTSFLGVIKEGTTARLETVSKTIVTCTGETMSGKYTGNKTIGEVFVTFTNCSAFSTSCTSAGAPAGTIATNQLEGVLGIEELGAEPVLNKIGEALFPVGRSGPIGEFTCGGLKLVMSGSVISPAVENMMKTTTAITSKASKGKQHPESFVGETPEPLMATIESGTPEQGGEAVTTIQTNEEKVEINTVL